MVKLLIVGGGRMGEALLGGLLAAGRDPAEITVVETLAQRRAELSETHAVAVSPVPVAAQGVVLAVKPDVAAPAAAACARAGADRILSVAAGVTLQALDAAVASAHAVSDASSASPASSGSAAALPILRAMPNTPALIGQGAAALCGNAAAAAADVAWAQGVLAAVGVVVQVPERLMDAVTGLSGSGPAYVFLVAEAMIDAGVQVGLSRHDASLLACRTLSGAAGLLLRGDRSPADLRADVTSPGGTTAAGLRELERHGVRAAIAAAVEAAAERSAALGRAG